MLGSLLSLLISLYYTISSIESEHKYLSIQVDDDTGGEEETEYLNLAVLLSKVVNCATYQVNNKMLACAQLSVS